MQGANFVSIPIGDCEARIEKTAGRGGRGTIRFVLRRSGRLLRRAPALTEKQLITLLKMAVRKRIISAELIRELRAEIEI